MRQIILLFWSKLQWKLCDERKPMLNYGNCVAAFPSIWARADLFVLCDRSSLCPVLGAFEGVERSMKKFAVTVAVLALGLAACQSQTEEAAENDTNVENAVESDTNAATNDAANAADNALDAAGNAIENAGEAVDNAGAAVENAGTNEAH
jgi:hypothetical protein